MDKPAILMSEPTYAKAIVKNRSAVPLTLQASWMGRNRLGRPENYTLEAIDASGKAVPTPDPGPQMGGLSWEAALTTDKSFETRLFLPSWAPFTAPGRYTIGLRTTLPLRRDAGAPWTEIPVVAQAVLTVLPDDAATLGQIIDSAAARVKPGDDEPIQILSAIRDPRVVPHFAALLASNNYSQKYEAIRALGTWNDDRALSALKGAMATQAADLDAGGYTTESLREQSAQQLRLAVAQALSESPHPGALELLLKMKNDAYEGVRLTVVHKAAKIDPAVGAPLLKAMARDANALVRGEAQRYLREKK
jgi:hypothetical protein